MNEKPLPKPQKNITLEEANVLFDNIVTNAYLKSLKDCDILPLEEFLLKEREKLQIKKEEQYPSSVRWYKITKIVKEKDVFFADQLSMLYIALHDRAKNVVLALKKENHGPIELFIGARDFEGTDCVSGEILESGLKGFLPGVDYEYVHEETFKNSVMDGLKNLDENDEEDRWKGCSVSSVSVLASLRDDKKENFIQGIEKLINASDAIPSFTAYFIAESVSSSEAASLIQAFNSIQSQLSPFSECHRTFSESHTEGVSENLTKGFSEAVSINISKTVTHSKGWNYGETITKGVNTGINANNSLILVGSGFHRDWNYSKSEVGNVHAERSEAMNTGGGKTKTAHSDKSHGREKSDTKGVSLQITHKNSQVSKYMDLIDTQVERLQKGIPFGLWSVATYFVAPEDTTVLELANIYKGCVVGENSNLSVGAVNLWEDNRKQQVLGYLNHLVHPQFVYKGIKGTVSPGTIVTSEELAIHLSLPQASVPGILVREEQAFGRNVPEELTDENSIDLGTIMYLGKEIKKNKANEENEKNRARIKVETLNKHVFVTGTTGSGKSNTLYQLISGLNKRGIRFLIIEPAKGEYKHVFGKREDMGVTVYGSNPKKTLLLHVNPFEFPEKIDVYQHVDALVEVFNACWPMYAAMPQVLSHSIIEAYKSCGWDMEHSLNPNKKFPTVDDVLECLKDYINKSEYSSDTKGDYKGSLETRLQSLCDGTVGRMFKGKPISDEELFNSNVIIDLSEVKSAETNSLIMGLLVLKLNEFRSSEKDGMNRGLHHVTVLEEAHNLLKRTSTNQIAESSNVAGMAVEKIANSMAEMRTYGEGFIIADQSPSMLDLATIRNTNTKIIMALPEKDDRETAGKSIGLDDKHIEEISKLKTGEAIVYQSGWEEAVKAKIEEYKTPTQPWTYTPEEPEQVCDNGAISRICSLLASSYTSVDSDFDRQELLDLLVAADIPIGRFNTIKKYVEDLTDEITPKDIAFVFATMVGADLLESTDRISDISVFNAKISRCLYNKLGLPNNERMRLFVNMYMKGCSLKAENPFYDGWLQLTSKIL